jgi:hypothetical protein
MNNDGNWDDTVIMKQFDAAFRSHISKRKGDSTSDVDKIHWVGIGQPSAWEPVQNSNSNNNNNNNGVRNDSNHIANSNIALGSSSTNTNTNTSNGNPSTKPIIDEALQEMLAAWYQSGYATGRYHAFKEMQDMNNNNNNNNNNI